jgi:hypothetical protein
VSGVMSGDELAAWCQAYPDAEHAHLTGLTPAGFLMPGPAGTSVGGPTDCTVLSCAGSGAMHLTGPASGPPPAASVLVVPRIFAVTDAIKLLTGRAGEPVRLLPRVLAGYAALIGWQRCGTVSASGTGGEWLIDVSVGGVRADPVRQSVGPAVGHVIARSSQGRTARHNDLVESARLS